ncbi:hypothetical protein GUJ93_ZPchr0013g37829 [Zizania palustris]|uniref:Disease resistance R13L4/SHOC-2-like LRR domain-containing protein n=1 Tax=Zizania palustris TaxID=103762 RepID=A0A8J5WQW5_ZIZPA|nr:hypothetical protein GUJ93_ZPchr0013g37829 [Zizania palustris]
MGCCSSRSSDSPASRVTRWRSTGIVALRDARLKVVPNEVLQVGNSLRILDLTNNKIVEIPEEVGRLVNMQRLVLAGNLIENISVNIGYLRNLKILMLDRNRISTLPEELGSLSNLQQLSISHNYLARLPKSVGSLHNMLLLNVSDNKLIALPESIGGCSSLEELQANVIALRMFSPFMSWAIAGTLFGTQAEYCTRAKQDVIWGIMHSHRTKSSSIQQQLGSAGKES